MVRVHPHTNDGGDRSSATQASADRELDEIAERFRRQARTMHPRAPLYVAMCDSIAANREVHALLLHAPTTQRLPVLLLAAIHAEVLSHPDAPLARWYPNITDSPRSPSAERRALDRALVTFCHEHHEQLARTCATRATQTNEIGRCAPFVPAFGVIADEMGPIAHLDVGTSAGLNLMWHRYQYRYEPGGDVGASSEVLLTCGTRGAVPVPRELPPVASSLGLDREPVDITEPRQARWLEACLWPDQLDRFNRFRTATMLAADDPPEIRRGDAIDDLADAVATQRQHGHPVITNSWVLNYLTPQQRTDYVEALDDLGSSEDVSWIFLESPQQVPELPVGPMLDDDTTRDQTVLTLVRWRSGNRRVDHLAVCHPHGYWMHWR